MATKVLRNIVTVPAKVASPRIVTLATDSPCLPLLNNANVAAITVHFKDGSAHLLTLANSPVT